MDPRLDCWLDEKLVGDPWTPLEAPRTPPEAVKPVEDAKGIVTRHKRKAKEGSSVRPRALRPMVNSLRPQTIVTLSATGVGAPNVSLQPRTITSVIFGWHEIKVRIDIIVLVR
jgi:hypothetical protein